MVGEGFAPFKGLIDAKNSVRARLVKRSPVVVVMF